MAHQQEHDAVRLDVAASLLEPVVDILEGAAVGDVEEEEPAHGVTVVSSGDRPAQVVKGERNERFSWHKQAVPILSGLWLAFPAKRLKCRGAEIEHVGLNLVYLCWIEVLF